MSSQTAGFATFATSSHTWPSIERSHRSSRFASTYNFLATRDEAISRPESRFGDDARPKRNVTVLDRLDGTAD
jgi:hypothetical protein